MGMPLSNWPSLLQRDGGFARACDRSVYRRRYLYTAVFIRNADESSTASNFLRIPAAACGFAVRWLAASGVFGWRVAARHVDVTRFAQWAMAVVDWRDETTRRST